MHRQLALCAIGAIACADPMPADANTPCVAALPRDCTDAFPASFDNVYNQLLLPSCGSPSGGGQCHADAEAKGSVEGLVIQEPDDTYDRLLGISPKGTPARVMQGNPECSPLVLRVASNDPAFRMPPDTPIAEPELCAITHWIAAGAKR